MADTGPMGVGDRVRIYLPPDRWRDSGWREGTIVRIEPYSPHRRFHWVELDLPAELTEGGRLSLVSVLNPRRIRKS